jgi:hypothetical protein
MPTIIILLYMSIALCNKTAQKQNDDVNADVPIPDAEVAFKGLGVVGREPIISVRLII